ncbi:hypothetical protein [Paraglaciecola psychrophila]|uniref:Uncharacterized protein n=1 Tax=Paraglaciecola psychrophila 170 TaxID=1129794 RepID=K6ZRV3_9ALTE|nr:hypothetical protein [Paraglaciecola psychrophila]AGH46620.1 hypothetical protein C427_4521 [Paraglaciecola psychrophila 170]GAC38661.1 hypothetical protein GPSY_3050 [Paraglaciecola psychrophila 170]
MNQSHTGKTGIIVTLTLVSILLFTSNNSLAELNQIEEIYTQKGYPYEGLVDRSEQVTIFYIEGTDNIVCRVEVSQGGQIWQGEERSISVNKFTQKPLRACMDREDAKVLLANTF